MGAKNAAIKELALNNFTSNYLSLKTKKILRNIPVSKEECLPFFSSFDKEKYERMLNSEQIDLLDFFFAIEKTG